MGCSQRNAKEEQNIPEQIQEFRIKVSVFTVAILFVWLWRIIVYLQVPPIPFSHYAFSAMGEHQFLYSIQDSDPKECDLPIDEGVCA